MQRPSAAEHEPADHLAILAAKYREQLAQRPNDGEALRGLAGVEVRLKNFESAIELYRRVTQLFPDDLDSLESLGRLYSWTARPQQALDLFQALVAKAPSDVDYQIELAGIQAQLKNYTRARELLASVLAAQPHSQDAKLQLANLELYQGHSAEALKVFNEVLKEDSTNFEARLGTARVAFSQGNLRSAYRLASWLVAEHPDDFDAVLLLATLERARHERRNAQELAARADRLSPRNPEVSSLEQSLREESRITFHTAASYAREISSTGFGLLPPAAGSEDLREFNYETTWGFSALPRTDSKFSLYYLPSNSPSAGIRGAAGPAQFLYHQTTWISSRLTLEGGVGAVRFGPGDLVAVPSQTQPIIGSGTRPVGSASATFQLGKKISLDVTADRSAIAETPVAVRLGVVESRLTGGLDFSFTSRTELHLEYFLARDSSLVYDHISTVNGTPVSQNRSDRDHGRGGTITFDRGIVRSKPLSFDLGYSGSAYGYAGHRNNVYLGFFNPSLYQLHQLTTRFYGDLSRFFGYDFSGGLGVQQVEQGGALTRALLLSPGLILKPSPRLSVTLGYIHYNNAQSLGAVRGNAVRLSMDWK